MVSGSASSEDALDKGVETPSGKELTTLTVASLGAEAVTPGLSVDSKVIGMAIERRNTQSAGRCCCQSRSQHNHMRYGEYTITVAASVRPIHVTFIKFRWNVLKNLHYWLNRRSQKKSYTWVGFLDMVTKGHPVVRPKSYYVVI